MENVLVIPTAVLDAALPQGSLIVQDIPAVLSLIQAHKSWLPRPQAEQDLAYRQIIPYAVLRNRGRVFMTRRLPKQGEARLHGKYSIGMGGHINRREADSPDPIRAGMARELREEVGLQTFPEPHHCAGIINDTTEEVGRYHLGLLFPLEVPEEVHVTETKKMEGGWSTEAEIEAALPKMEAWSQVVWRNRPLWER